MEQLNINNLLRRINVCGDNLRVALAVYQIVVEAIKLRRGRRAEPEPEPEGREYVEADNRIVVYRQNLLHLIDLLESYEEPCTEFMTHFTKWETARKENCALLKHTAEDLQYDHTACTATCLGANSLAAAGGITVLTGLIFPPAAPFLVCGMIASGLGGATAFSATVADVARINKHRKKMKKITNEDAENLKLLGNWLKHSQEVEAAMTELLNFSIWKKMWDNLKSIKKERDFWSERSSTFVLCIKACLNLVPPDHALFLIVGTDVSAAIITTIIAMILFHRQTRSILNADVLFLGIGKFLASSFELGRLVAASSSKAGSAAAKLIAKPAKTAALAGVGLAIDISMIVLNSIELSKKGMCDEGEMIIKVSDMLEEQRKILREVYQAMLIGR